MKMKLLMTMSIFAGALQLLPAASGQDADEPGKGRRGHWEERLGNLSSDERQKFQSARQKAMQDPAVQAAHEKMRQARKEFRDAMNAAMLKADPSVKQILDKLPQRHERNL